jgi:hypothetical protein
LRLSLFRLSLVGHHQVLDVANAEEGEEVKHLLNLRVGQPDEKLKKNNQFYSKYFMKYKLKRSTTRN